MVDGTPDKTFSPGSNSNIRGNGPDPLHQPEDEHPELEGKSFRSRMQPDTATPGSTSSEGTKSTPFDLASREAAPLDPHPSTDTILHQMTTASSALGDLQNGLHTKNLTLTRTQRYLLRSKLTKAHEHIRGASRKTGVDVGDPPSSPVRRSPVDRFLGLLTDGQHQLDQSQQLLHNLKLSGGSLSPTALLTIQIKLAKAQQELEYSSILLSKAVDDVKTLFNIQL
ncbi:MAG: hypothetical protein OXF02_00925 [Simkaniaceae bacterium]|nr:hypothetical protein [Simkaniaceae bacterium]